jgi:hypothetical protein
MDALAISVKRSLIEVAEIPSEPVCDEVRDEIGNRFF